MSKGITAKELRIAAKNVRLQYGLIDILINEAIKIRDGNSVKQSDLKINYQHPDGK